MAGIVSGGNRDMVANGAAIARQLDGNADIGRCGSKTAIGNGDAA